MRICHREPQLKQQGQMDSDIPYLELPSVTFDHRSLSVRLVHGHPDLTAHPEYNLRLRSVRPSSADPDP